MRYFRFYLGFWVLMMQPLLCAAGKTDVQIKTQLIQKALKAGLKEIDTEKERLMADSLSIQSFKEGMRYQEIMKILETFVIRIQSTGAAGSLKDDPPSDIVTSPYCICGNKPFERPTVIVVEQDWQGDPDWLYDHVFVQALEEGQWNYMALFKVQRSNPDNSYYLWRRSEGITSDLLKKVSEGLLSANTPVEDEDINCFCDIRTAAHYTNSEK